MTMSDWTAELSRGQRNPLRMVAGRRCDDTPRALFRRERGELVVGTPELEREDRLQVLPLEPDLAAEPGSELRAHARGASRAPRRRRAPSGSSSRSLGAWAGSFTWMLPRRPARRRRLRCDAFTWERDEIKSIHRFRHARRCPDPFRVSGYPGIRSSLSTYSFFVMRGLDPRISIRRPEGQDRRGAGAIHPRRDLGPGLVVTVPDCLGLGFAEIVRD